MTYHVYVSNSGSEFFSHFLMDEATGRLDAQPNIELDSTPGAGTTATVRLRLFADPEGGGGSPDA